MSLKERPIMTMDELAALEMWFSRHCRGYYTQVEEDNRNIRLKEEHTRRVGDNMKLLTATLPLDEGECRVAAAIALLHDVGRFEQYRRFKTFKDSESVNHAALGARTLVDAGVLDALAPAARKFILGGIALHNVFRIPTNLDPRLERFVKLVRDADKLDIWRVFVEFFRLPEEERASAVVLGLPDHDHCAPEVLQELRARKTVDLALVKTLNDFKLLQISWLYDLNFPASFRLLNERGVIDDLAATLPRHGAVAGVLAEVREHVAARGGI
jgi:hypothetical protein